MKTIGDDHGQKKIEEALHRLDTYRKQNSTKIGDALMNLAAVCRDHKRLEESLTWERKVCVCACVCVVLLVVIVVIY